MLSRLQIGNKTFLSNLIQAPLAGISCSPFRSLVWQFGGVAYCCTEMLSAKELAYDVKRSPRYYTKSSAEGPLCWQISGNDANELARAATKVVEKGADLIDLNCGCPQPKIRKKHCGSRLLEDERHLSSLVRAIKQHADVPVTMKIRIDRGNNDFCGPSLAKACEEAGVDAIIVHGRHWTDDYTNPACLDSIAKVAEGINIPVIGNGDINDAASLQKMFAHTGCAGVMIARASVGQPWLFQKLNAEASGHTYEPPTTVGIGTLLLRHVEGLMGLEGEAVAVMQARRFAKYYARDLPSVKSFTEQVNTAVTYADLQAIVDEYFAG